MRGLDVVAIVGSLRRKSVNRATARAAIAHAPDGLSITEHSVADLPLYNGDDESGGPPDAVARLHRAAAESDALIFFTPEYNSSLPAVTKNVIDWLSRPPKGWDGMAVTAVATTPGARAGAGVLGHFAEIIERQPVRSFESLGIGSYREKLDDVGELTDPATVQHLVGFLERYADFVRGGLSL